MCKYTEVYLVKSWEDEYTYVKSPVASLCLDCSSVRKRVRVTMSVFIFSCATGMLSPFACAMIGNVVDVWRPWSKFRSQNLGLGESVERKCVGWCRWSHQKQVYNHYYLILHRLSTSDRLLFFPAILSSSAPPNNPSCLSQSLHKEPRTDPSSPIWYTWNMIGGGSDESFHLEQTFQVCFAIRNCSWNRCQKPCHPGELFRILVRSRDLSLRFSLSALN